VSPRVNGTVPALSLVVNIEDLSGSSLYVKAGGIQVLSKLALAAGGGFGDTFVPVGKSQAVPGILLRCPG